MTDLKMLITRIGSEKELGKIADRIELQAHGKRYTITIDRDGLRINSGFDSILVRPCVGNEIIID